MSATKPWNILATTHENRHQNLHDNFKALGDFWWTEFKDVMIGNVKDHKDFFKLLQEKVAADPRYLDALAKLVPIDETFSFTKENLLDQLQKQMLKYVDMIGDGSYHVRFDRRGHAKDFHREEVELKLGDTIWLKLQELGKKPSVDFKDPDYIIVVETLGDECGVGHIKKKLRKKFPFIHNF